MTSSDHICRIGGPPGFLIPQNSMNFRVFPAGDATHDLQMKGDDFAVRQTF